MNFLRFPGHVKPVRDGVYLVEDKPFLVYSKFKNGVWHLPTIGKTMARRQTLKSSHQTRRWIGIEGTK